jgi:hypothetical protein
MHQNASFSQKRDELVIGSVQVIDPDRGVNKNLHRRNYWTLRLRRPAFARGAVPPSAASRSAASRWIRASRPR